MPLNREDMRDEVRFNVKRTTDGFSAAKINRRLNWSQDYLADLHVFEEMRKNYTGATADGTKRYGFPTRMKDIYSLTLQDGASSRKLKYVKAREFDTKIPRPEIASEGASDWYVDYGVNFELYRIPDATYTLNLRCSIYPVEFSADTSESTLLRKDALIVAIATVFALHSIEEYEKAAYWGQTIVPPLYEASLESDHSGEDWIPVARGFGGGGAATVQGNWWLNPFTGRNVPGY